MLNDASAIDLRFLCAQALAFQNLEASGVVKPETALEFTALGGSLGMMSKVLSDILDLWVGSLLPSVNRLLIRRF